MSEIKSAQNPYIELWNVVERELQKNDASANKVAVIETEKIFKKAMEDKDLPGKNSDDKARNYAHLFSNYEKLKYSRAMYKKVIDKIDFDISAEDTREIIKGYHEAIFDMNKIDFESFPLKEKIGLMLKRNFYGFPQKVKTLIAGLIALSLVTFIITETESGRSISAFLVGINNHIFYKVVPVIFFVVILAFIAIGILYAYQSKNK